MDGILYVSVLIVAVAFAGIRSRRPTAMPGVLLTFALVAGSAWYVLA